MCSGVGDWTCFQPGFPIRKSSNHSSVASSSRLIAGSYVLHRLLVPRHPPCALKNLTTDTKMLASTMQFSSYGREPLPITGAYPPTPPGTTRRRERTVRPKKRARRRNEQRPFPQDPTARQAGPTHPPRSTPTRRRGVLAAHARTSQLADVPPLSNHPGTLVRAVALDPTTHRATEPECSLERR